MAAAVVGLVGVVIGALLTGLGSYTMARREERKAARAAARLLESELHAIVGRLEFLTGDRVAAPYEGLRPFRPTSFMDLKDILNVPQPRLWDDHKAVLARVLSAADWYAVATAYESIDALRGAAMTAGLYLDDGQIAHSAIGEVLLDLADEARAGARAVARLAGNPAPALKRSDLRHRMVILFRNEARNEPGGDG